MGSIKCKGKSYTADRVVIRRDCIEVYTRSSRRTRVFPLGVGCRNVTGKIDCDRLYLDYCSLAVFNGSVNNCNIGGNLLCRGIPKINKVYGLTYKDSRLKTKLKVLGRLCRLKGDITLKGKFESILVNIPKGSAVLSGKCNRVYSYRDLIVGSNIRDFAYVGGNCTTC